MKDIIRKVTLDRNIERTLFKGDNIGIGAFKNITFSITVVSGSSDETSNPYSDKTFTLQLLGEINSVITWITPSNLDVIDANFISTLRLHAETSVPNTRLLYRLVDGELPPGLQLIFDGEIVGKVRQFGEAGNLGLTVFDSNTTIFDEQDTIFDRIYTFTVEARDRFNYSASQRTFTLEVTIPDNLLYSNLYFRPFLTMEQRNSYFNFLSDTNVFIPENIYRPHDTSFGLQKQIQMLVYAGIETRNLIDYSLGIVRSHKRKKFRFGDLKIAVAKDRGTNEIIYEVLYIEIIDTLELNNDIVRERYASSIKNTITVDSGQVEPEHINDPRFSNIEVVTVDNNIVHVGGETRYIVNITNMRKQISKLGKTELNFLPLWMRTPQERNSQELGYVPAIPICYCIPGRANQIRENVINSGYDFKLIDFDIDRYVVTDVTGSSDDQYIIFKDNKANVS